MFRKWLYVILIIAIAFCGCAVTLKPIVDLPPSTPRIQKTVGVYQSPEFRNYQTTAPILVGADAKIPLGSASVTLFRELFPKAFEKVVWIERLPTIATAESPFAAVIEPQIDAFKFLFFKGLHIFHSWAEIHYRFVIYTPDGKVIASWTVKGVGEYSGGGSLAQAVDFAMHEAAWRFIQSFNDVPEAKRWLQGLPQQGAKADESAQTTRPAPEFSKGAMLGTYPGVVAVSIDASHKPGHKPKLGTLNDRHILKAGQLFSIRVMVENHGNHRLLLRRKDIALVSPDGTEINPLPTSTFEAVIKGPYVNVCTSTGMSLILDLLLLVDDLAEQGSIDRKRMELEAELLKDLGFSVGKELYDSTLTKGKSVQGCVYFFVPEEGASLDDLKLAVPVIDYDAATWYTVRLPLTPP